MKGSNKMKKITCILLILVMLTCFVACDIDKGGNDGSTDGGNTDNGITDGEGYGDKDNIGDNSGDNTDNNGGNNSGDNTEKPEPKPDIDPDPNKITVYLLNRAAWEQVAIYYWGSRGEIYGGWPGERVELGEDGLYRAVFDKEYTNLIFNNNNNGSQTADLKLPVGDKIVYDNVDNRWITYAEAVVLSGGNGGNTDKPNPDPKPDTEPVTVYLINRAGWDEVAIYCWSWSNQVETVGGWPGEKLSVGDDGLYKATVDRKFDSLIFNNNNNDSQTIDLLLPVGDRIVYDNLYNFWITYSEAMMILDSEGGDDPDTPHDHIFVDGKCECGEVDPDYVPDTPHEHNFVDGKCECGEVDPDYVPDTPHEHNFVDGKCECGETDPDYVPDTPHEHIFVNGKCECGEADPDYVPETPDISDEMALFYDLFDYNNHISLKLDISNSELKKIQQDYEKYSKMGSKSPIYRMADLIVTITKPDGTVNRYVIEQVGVRMKGNTSRTSFYNDWDGMYNLVHFKISFQETFDDTTYYGSDALTWADSAARKERKNRTFATLEKIDMRWNRNDDTTYIRENYAYDLYREFGVLAPHTNLASVDIGKDHAGVWVIYEPIDKIFLEKNLPESALGGDLYKLGWTSEGATFTSFSSYGVEDEDAGKFYVYDLKTNKKTSTHEALRNLINTIKSSTVTKEKFASVVDMESFLYYCAVSYIVGNPDDLRNNYNNTYIYFRPDTGKMVVIPYDMDRGLGVNTWNPTGNGMTKDDPFSKKALGNNSDQKNPLFLKSVCTGGFFISEYIEALKEVDASEMLTNAKFSERFEIAKNLYSGDATPSKNYNNAGGYKFRFDISRTCAANESKNMSFANYISAKRQTLYKHIGDQGNTDNTTPDDSGNSGSGTVTPPDPITNCKPYVMGDMSGWQVNSQYAMKSNGDGTFSFTLTPSMAYSYNGSQKIKFKLLDNNNGTWYGGEIISPNCTVSYDDNNGNRNIYLEPGTYILTFDSNTVTLYIEKAG